MRKTLFTASVLAVALAAPFAQAHQAGDVILRAGAITVDPHEDSGNVKIGGAGVSGTGATLNSDTQLGLNFAYMVTDNIGIELLAATPFSHEVGTKGLGGLKLGELKHLPPTLSVVYYPLEKSSAFQPYVGAGINYTWFFDDELSSEAEAAGFRGLPAVSYQAARQGDIRHSRAHNTRLLQRYRLPEPPTDMRSGLAKLLGM